MSYVQDLPVAEAGTKAVDDACAKLINLPPEYRDFYARRMIHKLEALLSDPK